MDNQPPTKADFDQLLFQFQELKFKFDNLMITLEAAKKTTMLTNLSADPLIKTAGAIAVVSGKLKIYDGSNWVVVGTQV